MKGSKPFGFLALSLCLCVLLMSACGSSHPPNGPGALNIANSSLPGGVVQSLYRATLIPTGGLAPYTWTLNSGTLPPGLNLSSGGVISGTPLITDLNSDGTAKTYNFVVKVTDSQTPTAAFQTKAFSIVINPLPVVTSTTLPDATIGLPYFAQLTVDGGLAPFTWSVTVGTLPAGLSISGPSIGGTPTGPSGDFPFTIQVTDADGNTATAQVSISVKGKLEGNFAFSFNGFDQQGKPFYTVGSFVGDGAGNITSGVLDQNGLGSPGVVSASFTGTYTIGRDNGTNDPNLRYLGSMTLNIQGLGTFNYSLAVPLNGDMRFILADTTHPDIYGSGVIKAQDLSKLSGLSSLAGNWSLGFFGVDNAGNRSAGAGAFKADNSGNLTSGIEDTNDNGTVQSQVSFTGSFANVDVTTGRGTATVNVGANTLTYAFYVVNPKNELVAVQTDPVSGGASLSLVSLLQPLASITGGGFSNAALNASVVMELNGVSILGPDVSLGVSTFDGMGNITLYQTDENNGGTYIPATPTTGTYSVASNGRVTVTGIAANPVWYLVSANQGFVIGTDSSVTAGYFEPQSGAPFNLASFLLSYAGGTIQPVLASVTNEVDSTVIPAPGGTIVVTYDTSGSGGPQMNLSLASTYVLGDDPNNTGMNTTGKFILTAKGSPVPTEIVYMITAQPSGGTTLLTNKWASINIATPTGSPEPNPSLTVVQSTHK